MAEESPTAKERITYSSGDTSLPPELRLLHFNDVYHIDPSSAEPVGGISRFKTICNEYGEDARFPGQPGVITLFSGDAFNPSLESSVTKGGHMVPVLNSIGTDVACVGNHDLDFGIGQFRNLAQQCTFPWLLANVIDPALGDDIPLGNAKKSVILTSSNGIKIGVIGLVEREWLDTINLLPPNLIYRSASAVAKDLIPGLRKQGAELIVALTHQREPNDNKLAEKTPDGLIDIILGGHDHFYKHDLINGTHILRSGTDFKQLSYIEARRQGDGKKWNFHIIRRDIMSSVPEDPKALKLAATLTSSLKSKLRKPVGYTAAPLDARFTTVRLKESNIGNFVCDLMRSHYGGDCCLIAAGTIRGDQIYPPGQLKMKDIMNCFPFEDPCVVLKVRGSAILEAIENSVSLYPALEGRFPQVSNIEFEFDPSSPPNSRVRYVDVGGAPLDHEKLYVLVTRGYMARGKDGFDSLLAKSEGGQAVEIVSEENGILISMMLRQYFMSLKILGQWRMWGNSIARHWKEVHDTLHKAQPIVEPQNRSTGEDGSGMGATDHVESEDDMSNVDGAHHVMETENDEERRVHLIKKITRKWRRLAGLPGHADCCDSMREGEFTVDWTSAIAPRLEGRIRIIEIGKDLS